MFPPFIDSFGDQFSAVLVNAFGSIAVSFISAIIGSFVTGFVTPLFKSLAVAVGLPV